MNCEYFMKEALKEAKKAGDNKEIPIGAVVIKNNKIIARAHNQKEKKCDVTAHAEILALKKAMKKVKNWRLDECEIYVTLEPCPMCASAIHQARINKIYYGISNLNCENKKILEKIVNTTWGNKKVELVGGILEKECKEILQSFFEKSRK